MRGFIEDRIRGALFFALHPEIGLDLAEELAALEAERIAQQVRIILRAAREGVANSTDVRPARPDPSSQGRRNPHAK